MTNKKDTGEQKRKVSVALEYVPGEEAPKIIASGKGVLAALAHTAHSRTILFPCISIL